MNSTDPPTVAIAVTTCDGEDFVEEQLRSFERQTLTPNQVVISDDASTDNTIDICRRFAREMPFDVALLENSERAGYSKNFERAMSATSADVVFLSDQDDVWHETKLERVVEEFHSHPECLLVIHDVRFCDEKLRPNGQTKLTRVRKYRDPLRGYITGMATAVRKPFLDLCLPLPSNVETAYDSWIHGCARLVGGKRVLPLILADYRRHDRNVTEHLSVNSAEAISSTKLLRSLSERSALEDLRTNIPEAEALLGWLEANRAALAGTGRFSDEWLDAAGQELRGELAWMRYRIGSLTRRRISRLHRVFRQLVVGGYAQFSGIRSALKDVLVR